MNLEQAKTRKTQLEREVEVAKEEIYTFSIDKSKLEQQAQNLQDKIEFKSRDLNTKQQEINTLATAIESILLRCGRNRCNRWCCERDYGTNFRSIKEER